CSDDSECCGGSCTDGMCAEGSCTADGEICAASDECCGRICTPDENGILRCQDECVPLGGNCTTEADCCTDGTCGDREVECVPIGGTCQETADCCDGLCDNNGICFSLDQMR